MTPWLPEWLVHRQKASTARRFGREEDGDPNIAMVKLVKMVVWKPRQIPGDLMVFCSTIG